MTRRLRGLAALDPEFEQVIRARDERRRKGLHVLVQRFGEQQSLPAFRPHEDIVNMLYTLLSFECFDTLAGPARPIEEVVPAIQRLVHATLASNQF